jgi:hypothetical protein
VGVEVVTVTSRKETTQHTNSKKQYIEARSLCDTLLPLRLYFRGWSKTRNRNRYFYFVLANRNLAPHAARPCTQL